MKKRMMTSGNVSAVSRMATLLIVVVIGCIASPDFLSGRNIGLIITNASILIILGIGQTVAIITSGPDLSAGSIMTICCVIASMMVKNGHVWFPLAMLAALCVGLMFGYLNGFMVAKVGIPSFISTYGLQWAVFGFAYVILRGYVMYDFPDDFRFIGNGKLLGIDMPIIVMVIFVVIMHFVMTRTTQGRKFYAVGSNPVTAKMSGINSERTIIFAFMISGFFAAWAGIMFVARNNAVQSDIGKNYLLTVLATVYMGGTSPNGGEGTILGSVVGALIIQIVQNLMNLVAVPSDWRDAIIGALIIATVLSDLLLKKRVANMSVEIKKPKERADDCNKVT